jgi:serine protease AprX
MILEIFRRRAALLVTLVVVVAGLVIVFGSSATSPSQKDKTLAAANKKIAPEVVADTADGARASVVVFMADQADVSAAYDMKDQDARGWYVYNTLSEHAARTQAPIKAMLDAESVQYQSFWVANMLVVEGDRALVDRLAARDDVAGIDPNRPSRGIEDPAISTIPDEPGSPLTPETVETGVNNVQAPPVWSMGFNGQGIVIANQDTGMRWTHNAIKGHYRGWNGATADHNYNWHDSIHSGGGVCGVNSQQPCDDDTGSTHGTHTTGTTNGDDGAGNQIGVAPGAKWIGCRNMNQGAGTPATYSECFQFFIAPTDLAGNNPNPALRPHVMNNSWGCPTSEGCTTRAELETIVNNTEAAGIFVVVSAGNSGSGCASVTDPAAIYSASFSVGAISGTTNNIASFSSRGPSTFYSPNILKPNISAPGVGVRSSQAFSDSSYGSLSGTSMAGPHVVGVVALLWSARPQLIRDIAATKSVLQSSANPNVNVSPVQTCGGTPSTQIPNNSFGYGRVDALAAVNAVGNPTPTPSPWPCTSRRHIGFPQPSCGQ